MDKTECKSPSMELFLLICYSIINKSAAGMHDTPPCKFNLVQMHRISLSINSQDKEQNKILS